MSKHPEAKQVTGTVPAKLILSGEHAVVYGAPALAAAIDLQAHVSLSTSEVASPTIRFQLQNLEDRTFSSEEIEDEFQYIDDAYRQFLNGTTAIGQVIRSPARLALAAYHLFATEYPPPANHVRHFEYTSQIPPGRGLGASAALVTAMLGTLLKLHGIDDKNILQRLARMAENYQHGRSSGLDTLTVIEGGLIRFQQGKHQHLTHDLPLPIWLIDTGRPESTTGEAVAAVAARHSQDTALWQAFATCTGSMVAALRQAHCNLLLDSIRENQRLLQHIGVVPPGVARLIEDLAPLGAAKVCGAGAVRGNQGGIVMLAATESPAKICRKYNFSCRTVQIVNQGASFHVVQ